MLKEESEAMILIPLPKRLLVLSCASNDSAEKTINNTTREYLMKEFIFSGFDDAKELIIPSTVLHMDLI